MTRLTFNLISLAMTVAALFGVTGARAETFPSRPITIVVPFAPGGPSDVITRIVGGALSKELGQPVIIENVAGAGGATGSSRVAAAAPDGYTLLSGSIASHVAAPLLYANLHYDAKKDFEPVGLVMHGPAVVVARKTIPAANLAEFVAFLKAANGNANEGNGGIGSNSHMACLLFDLAAGVKANRINYRGSAPALNEVIAGNIDYVCDSTMGMTEQIKAGNVKAFVVSSPDRSPAIPDVPTGKEAGLAGYDLSLWSALFAPKGTPAEAVAALNAALGKVLDDKGVIERVAALGGTVAANRERAPDHLSAIVDADLVRWGGILDSPDIKKSN